MTKYQVYRTVELKNSTVVEVNSPEEAMRIVQGMDIDDPKFKTEEVLSDITFEPDLPLRD